MQEEGLENIISRHARCRYMVREAVKEMGLNLLAADENASPALTSVIAPPELGANRIRQAMKEEFNIVMAGGQQRLDDIIFRIGHLGYVRELDLLSVLAALEIILINQGFNLKTGTGIRKAREILLQTHQKVEKGE